MQFWLGALCVLAALACVRALLLPPWPRAQPLSPERIQPLLSQVGLALKPLPPLPPRRTEGLALSSGLSWRVSEAATLRLAFVHVRRRDDFQVSWITRGQSQLLLKDRRLNDPEAGLASGRIQGRPAVQTCLVYQRSSPAVAAFTLKDLQRAVDRLPLTPADRLGTVLGLRNPRELRCLLITLQSATPEPPPPQSWRRVLEALQGLRPTSAPAPGSTGG